MKRIDKDKVIAEIERRMQELHPTNTHKMQVGEKVDRDVLMWLNALTWVKNLLDTLEVKEVDLGKESDVDKWVNIVKKHYTLQPELLYPKPFEIILENIEATARFFYKLGLKSQIKLK